MLIEPESNTPAYAAMLEVPTNTPDPPPWRGAAQGLKVAIPPLSQEARFAFENAMLQIGLTPVPLGFGEIAAASTRGLVDLGFVVIDSPAALTSVE